MTDLLFVELGAIVTEILGPKKCTVELFCDLKKPTFGREPGRRVEVDLELSLDDLVGDRKPSDVATAAQTARYDQATPIEGLGSAPIGPSWPGGEYERILAVRAEDVKANPVLADAATRLRGRPWEYQVVVSIDPVTGARRRYHGFHAEIREDKGGVLMLAVANAGRSADPDSARTIIHYDPTDTRTFYSGKLVADTIVGGGVERRRSGAVFIAVAALVGGDPSLPKLPPDASSSEIDSPLAKELPDPASRPNGPAQRTVTTITAVPLDQFQKEVKETVQDETDWPLTRSRDLAQVAAQRRQQVHELFRGAELVDLVGHSTPIRGYLKLGDWVLDPQEAERLGSYMPPSVKSVRLIGCATAKTIDGRAAAAAIARRGLSAYGTINNVYTSHFDKQGVKRGGGGPALRVFLPSATRSATSGAEEPVRSTPAGGTARSRRVARQPLPVTRVYAPGITVVDEERSRLWRALTWLVQSAWWVITAPYAIALWLVRRLRASPDAPHQWIWWLLGPVGSTMPGLLTEPLLVYEIEDGQTTWTLEILFDFEYARYYASTDSPAQKERVYKIRGSAKEARTLLESYLPDAVLRGGQARSRVALRRRHEEAGDRGGPLEPALRVVRAERASHTESRASTG